MDADSWAARLSSTSKRYQYALQSRSSEMFMGFEDIEVDDDMREEFPCPFCTGYFDIVGLCCHIDDEHHLESKNGVFISFSKLFALIRRLCYAFCGSESIKMIVGYNILKSLLLQIAFYIYMIFEVEVNKSLTNAYMQQKRKGRKGGSISTLSLLRRELREGNLQSLFGGSSYLAQSANVAPDPLLSSFILPIGGDLGGAQSNSSVEAVAVTKSTSEQASERYDSE
ncbi:hypothetical protein L1987_40649 [Smallanthus sonchifolius]|uniref:Uncharacterized protein n=1 Tax=Smallanthus sonchifolius TaxID=185202 RepID=A0ACB9GU48_9ASTR|nr:hypothetical protein L1987_40649 [Smallanthus sonchifolius]